MVRFYFTLCVFLQVHSSLCGQNVIDSLKQLLYENNDNQLRVEILNELASTVYDTDANEGFNYATEAYEHSKLIKYEIGEKRALLLMGYRFTVSGEFQKALRYYRDALLINSVGDELTGYSYSLMGNVYRSLANYDSARYFYGKSISILERNPNPVYLPYAYKSLAKLFVIQWKNREAEVYFKKAQKIYEAENTQRGLADVWFSLSDVNRNLTNYQLAHDYTNKGCTIAGQVQIEYLNLLCYKSQSVFYNRLSDYLKSLDVLFKALEILKTKEQPQLLASLYAQLGEVYEELGQHDVALKYFFDALKITERIGVRYEMAKIYAEIGWIYKNQLNFVQAKAYMDKSMKIREEIKDEHGISNSYNILGVLYYQEKKYDQALALLEKSLAIRKKIGHREGISACLFNIAVIYEDLGQFQKALKNQFEALEIDESIGNKQGLSISYNQIGQVYTKSGNYSEATKYLTKALDLSKEKGSKLLMMNNKLFFSSLFEAKGDYKQALKYHQEYTRLNDSIYSEGNAIKLAEMQALYQVEQKNQEIELLNRGKELQSNQIKLQRTKISQQKIIIIFGLVGLALIVMLAVKTYQYTSRIKKAHLEILEQKEEILAQSEELIEANHTIALINKDLEVKIEDRTSALRQAYKELDTFFYRSSHDFRRPLTTFLGLAEVATITVKDDNALELFAKVKETAINLDKMLIKLQSISDVGTQQLVYKEVFVKEAFENICDSFGDELRTKNIKVSSSIELRDSFYSYPAMFKTIIENLVENSIFFSGIDRPHIKVRAYNQDCFLILEVEDNGQGIDVHYQDRIFEMYFRGNERSKGNGLGLYIVKKAVEKLSGQITFQSVHGKGSTFRVSLPTNHNHSL